VTKHFPTNSFEILGQVDNSVIIGQYMDSTLKHMLSRDAIIVKQDTELGNVILGFDAANRYIIFDPSGEVLGNAAEEGSGVGGWLVRQFLQSRRPCTLHIYNPQGQEIITGKKPFRFMFSEMSTIVGDQNIGVARRRFNILKRKYSIDVEGSSGFQIESSIFQFGRHSFDVTKNGLVVAKITKKFEGMLKMAFTQADTFSITFHDKNLTLEERNVLLLTLFLIDYDVFEQR